MCWVEPCRVEDLLHLRDRDLGAGLSGSGLRIGPGPGREETPGGSLPEGEQEDQAGTGDHHVEPLVRRLTAPRPTGQLEVGQDDFLAVGPALPPDPGRPPNRAVRAVATHDEPAREVLRAFASAQDDTSGDRRGGRTHQLGPSFDLDPALPQRFPQHGLDVHLPHQREVRERGVVESHVPQLHRDGSVAQVQSGCGGTVRAGQQGISHPQRAQGFQGPRVHDHGPGGTEGLGSAFHDTHPRPVRVRLQRRRETGGAGTHHEHVRAGAHDCTTRHQAATSDGPRRASNAGSARAESRCRPGTTW